MATDLRDKKNREYPHGVCECDTGLVSNPLFGGMGCCQGTGPVAFKVTRDGQEMKVCTRCDLPSDESKILLVTKEDDIRVYMDFDTMGALCIAGLCSSAR